jgi:hypothetical protein
MMDAFARVLRIHQASRNRPPPSGVARLAGHRGALGAIHTRLEHLLDNRPALRLGMRQFRPHFDDVEQLSIMESMQRVWRYDTLIRFEQHMHTETVLECTIGDAGDRAYHRPVSSKG